MATFSRCHSCSRRRFSASSLVSTLASSPPRWIIARIASPKNPKRTALRPRASVSSSPRPSSAPEAAREALGAPPAAGRGLVGVAPQLEDEGRLGGTPLPAMTRERIAGASLVSRAESRGEGAGGPVPGHPHDVAVTGVAPTPCAGSGRRRLCAGVKLESLGTPASRGFAFVGALQDPSREKTRRARGSRVKVLTHWQPRISSASVADGSHRCGTGTSCSSRATQGTGGADRTPTGDPREEERSAGQPG